MRVHSFIFPSLLMCCVLSSSALAAPIAAPSSFDKFMQRVTGSGKQTVGFGLDGTPVTAGGVPTVDTDGGMPRVDTSGHIRNPSGNPVPVNSSSRVPATEIVKAVGRASVNLGLKLAAVLGAGVVLYDLAKEIDFILSRNPDGTLKYERVDPTVCTVAPCYTYATRVGGWDIRSGPNQHLACTAAAERATAQDSAYTWTCTGVSGGLAHFQSTRKSDGSFFNTVSSPFTTTPADPSSPAYLPSTYQEFVDAVAARSGWPSGSAVARLIAEDNASGAEKIKTGPHTVTGPATSPGTSSQTQKPNGTTETKNVTHNHTYNGNTITTTTTTVINIYNPTTNTTETETTVETPSETPEPEVAVTDTTLPEQPKLYTPKYPLGLTGVWAAKKAELSATPLASVVSQLMPSIGTGGTCPQWDLNLNLGTWNYGAHNVAPPCYIWDWCKFFIIAGALLLARALIFGG